MSEVKAASDSLQGKKPLARLFRGSHLDLKHEYNDNSLEKGAPGFLDISPSCFHTAGTYVARLREFFFSITHTYPHCEPAG